MTDQSHVPLARASDAKQVALLATSLVLSWLLPRRAWPGACHALTRLTASPRLAYGRDLRRRAPPELAVRAGLTVPEFVRASEDLHVEGYFELLRGYRPFAAEPEVRLEGLENVRAALEAGRGAILWVAGCVSSDLITKLAFHQAGLRVVHLSRPTHGFSTSRFGMRLLNGVRRRREDRYLAARVVTDDRNAPGPLRELYRTLNANGLVSITAGDEARSPIERPFLGRKLRIAPGAPLICGKTDARLLPAFTMRLEPGRYRVVVQPPIPIEGDRRPDSAVDGWVQRLDAFARAHPLLWTGWRGDRLS